MAFFDKSQEIIRNLSTPIRFGGFRGAAKGAGIGYEMGFKGGSLFVIGGAAYGMATAPRGQAISQGASYGVGFGVSSLIGGIIGGALGGVPGAYVGSLAAQFIGGETIDKAIAGVVQPAVDFGTNMRRARFGGDYRDTQTAYTMRSVAAREMSRSLMNARQFLGQESAFMHQ
jgi:hypothetical protein